MWSSSRRAISSECTRKSLSDSFSLTLFPVADVVIELAVVGVRLVLHLRAPDHLERVDADVQDAQAVLDLVHLDEDALDLGDELIDFFDRVDAGAGHGGEGASGAWLELKPTL